MSQAAKVPAAQDSTDRDLVKGLMDLRVADVSPVRLRPRPTDPAGLPPEVRAALRQTPIPQALITESGDIDTELLQDPHRIDIDKLHDEEEADRPAVRTVEVLDVEILDPDECPAPWRRGQPRGWGGGDSDEDQEEDGGAAGPNWRYVPRRAALTDSDEHASDSASDERAGMYPSEYSDGCERGSGSGSRYSDGEW
jgi:hypothetical protein